MPKKIISAFFVVVFLGVLVWSVYTNWSTIISYSFKFSNLDLTLLVLFLLPITLWNAVSWHLVVKSFNPQRSFLADIKIWLFSSLARFLPGGIWQYAGRIYLSKKSGLSVKNSSTALFLEAILCVFAGSIVSLLYLKSSIALLVIILLIIFFQQKIFQPVISLIIKRLLKKDFSFPTLTLNQVIILLISYILQFILAGSVLFFIIRGLQFVSIFDYPKILGIFSLSWLVGYVSFFSPSGLGVQEISLATLLTSYLPFSVASVVAIIFRILLLVSEAFTLALQVVILKKYNTDDEILK